MCAHPDLPAAVDFETQEDLHALDGPALEMLLRDCSRWCNWMKELKSGLGTRVGRTEWLATMQSEASLVEAAEARLRQELQDRASDNMDSSTSDVVHPGSRFVSEAGDQTARQS